MSINLLCFSNIWGQFGNSVLSFTKFRMTGKTFYSKQQGSSSEVRSSCSSFVRVKRVLLPSAVPELNVQYTEIPQDSQARLLINIHIIISFQLLIVDVRSSKCCFMISLCNSKINILIIYVTLIIITTTIPTKPHHMLTMLILFIIPSALSSCKKTTTKTKQNTKTERLHLTSNGLKK